MHLLSGWLRLRKWIAVYRDHARRLAGAEVKAPLFIGLARARFGLSMAASGMSASRGRVPEGRNLSPRKGGARLYLTNGMSREATQDLGGWKTPGVMENARNKARSKAVVPEVRPAINKASTLLGAQASPVDLDNASRVNGEEVVGSDIGAPVRVWFRRLSALEEYFMPPSAFPIRVDCRVLRADAFVGSSCRKPRSTFSRRGAPISVRL